MFLDAGVVLVAVASWFCVVGLDGLSSRALAGVVTGPWMFAAYVVSTSHILYAVVWFCPARFVATCTQPPLNMIGSSPVNVFAFLVTAAKISQQLGLIVWVAVAALSPLEAMQTAGSSRWLLAIVLIGLGQALNAGIYAAIGKDGVYYGFKLGAPVPWSDGFPFNLGFRHPQYVGGYLSQLGVIALLASPSALEAGLLPLGAWWGFLYAVTSWMEASGDNESEESAKSR